MKQHFVILVAALVGGPILIYVVMRAALAILYLVAICNLFLTIFCPELNQLVHQLFWTIVYLSRAYSLPDALASVVLKRKT
jgi:hypothetical protein